MISVEEAQRIILDNAPSLSVYTSPVLSAQNSYLAEDILSDRDLPPFKKAMMDGYAFRFADTKNHQQFRIKGIIGAGENAALTLNPGETVRIMTGAMVPEDADSIMPVEDAVRVMSVENTKDEEQLVSFPENKLKANMHVNRKGHDSVQGTVLVKQGRRIDNASTTVCASVGKIEIKVYRKPVVRIISTGTEVIPASQTPLDYQIRDGNSYSLRSLCAQAGVDSELTAISEDDKESLKQHISQGLDSDILLLSGGVSMGEYDFVPAILKELGVKEVFHKVRLKPGKPLWFGIHDNGYVFGLPGNPVSAQMNFKLFVEPLIKKLSGSEECLPVYLDIPFKGHQKNKKQQQLYFPVQLLRENGKQILQELNYSGSADFAALTESDGMALIPENQDQITTGDLVSFLPWRNL